MSVIVPFKRQKVVFDPLMKGSYHDYLESSEWKLKRAGIVERAQGCCEDCGQFIGNRGIVHHKSYERIFEEDNDDLVYVCWNCNPH